MLSQRNLSPLPVKLAVLIILFASILASAQGAPSYCSWTKPWSATANLSTARAAATATLLTTGPNAGEVLVAGGSGAYSTNTAELYNPATGTYTATGSMASARYYHTATLLNDGKVLIVGGLLGGGAGTISSAELYDPTSGAFTSGGTMKFGRYGHTATLLDDGTVLITGGSNGSPSNTAELYTPPEMAGNSTGSWTQVANMTAGRSYHTATLLSNGDVLLTGGEGTSGVLASAEIYVPSSRGFVATSNMSYARAYHTATALPDGSVAIIGGFGSSGDVAVIERFYPGSGNSGTFYTSSSLLTARDSHTATLLPSGAVLIAGGESSTTVGLTSAELYFGSSVSSAGTMAAGTVMQASTLLPNGQILVAGGYNAASGPIASSQVYDPLFSIPMGGIVSPRVTSHTASLLSSGQVLVAGGYGPSSAVSSSWIFYPSTVNSLLSGIHVLANNFVAGPALNQARYLHTSTTLPSGQVLITGGSTSWSRSNALNSAELFSPASTSCTFNNGIIRCTPVPAKFTLTATMVKARYWHTATYIPSINKVLIAGGSTIGTNGLPAGTSSAELFDPSNGTFSSTGSMLIDHYGHAATLIHINGAEKVLITGGWSDAHSGITGTSEIYDPASGTFSSGPYMTTYRTFHQATPMADGRVLITGGLSIGENPTTAAEIYNPATNQFSSTGNMTVARSNHTATLTELGSGKILIVGGETQNSGPETATAELYDPSAGTFSATPANLNLARENHTATLLADGRVLLVGGDNSGTGNPYSLAGATGELLKDTYCATPAIRAVNPSSGSVGSTFTVTGSHFGPTQNQSYVGIGNNSNGYYIAPVTSWSDTQITATVPSVPSGIQTNVIVNAGTVQSNSEPFTVLRTLIVK